MKQIFNYLTILLVAFSFTACEFEDIPKDFEPDDPDPTGNLRIINYSSQRLVLYKDEYLIKKIPASATDYLVFIENSDGGNVQLDLYLWEDVKDDVNNPDPSAAYKRWLVPLSPSTEVEQQCTWHIDSDNTYVDAATVNFSYFGGTDYFVDVYLNGSTGAKILTLKPGEQYKKVGVDYGNYSLAYKYWFSDQNNADLVDESKTVWIDSETINDQDVKIWLVLNENRSEVTTIVPHNGIDTEKKSYYGYIKITNDGATPVLIKAGDQPIEYVCYLDGNKTNYSTIPANSTTTFVMPITDDITMEESYILSAYDLEGRFIEESTITITEEETVPWLVDGVAD